MKYLSYKRPQASEPTWGILADSLVHDLGPTGLNLAKDLHSAIADGVAPVADGVWDDAPTDSEKDIEFLPVIGAPNKILCIGVNYVKHQQETGRTDQKAPSVFTRFADSQIGHQADAVKPVFTDQFDYEGEVALVIGKDTFRVSEEEAFDHVAGYGIYNDFTVRDWQRATSQWVAGKTFPGTGGFGPYFVPSEDIEDLESMKLETRVNGEIRQSAHLSDLYFSIPQLIAHCSTFTPLAAGDIIVTGTPGGVGLFMDPPGLLNEGDVVEVEVTNLGILRNTVRTEA